MTEVTLLEGAHDALLAHASRAYPREACGLLIGVLAENEARVTRALPCPNIADASERERGFMIDPGALLNVRRSLRGTDQTILGFYHSHADADATPSGTDLAHIRLWPETVWLITPVLSGQPYPPRAWWLDGLSTDEAREVAVRRAAPAFTLAGCPE